MAKTVFPLRSPAGVDPTQYRTALNRAISDLDEAEFRDLTERVRLKLARRAAANEIRSMIDAQVRPGLAKLSKRVRRDLEVKGHFAAGRLRGRGGTRV